MSGIPYYRVFIPSRPTGEDYAAVRATELSRARVMQAREVRLGDTVLADFPALGWAPADRLVRAEHLPDPFWATPEPASLACTCTCCQSSGWTLADGPLVKLADGFPWDGCAIYPATELLLVAPHHCDCGCNTTLASDYSAYDWTSAASVQHLMATGRPLRLGEALGPSFAPA